MLGYTATAVAAVAVVCSPPRSISAWVMAIVTISYVLTTWIGIGTNTLWGHVVPAMFSFMLGTQALKHDGGGLPQVSKRIGVASALVFLTVFLREFEHKDGKIPLTATFTHCTIYVLLGSLFLLMSIQDTLGPAHPLAMKAHPARVVSDPATFTLLGLLLRVHQHDVRPMPVAQHNLLAQIVGLVAACSLVSALVHKFVPPSHRAAKATRLLLAYAYVLMGMLLSQMCLTLYLTKDRSVEPHVFVGLHDIYFKNLKRRTIEEVARMYLALSGWLSIVLVVALAAWQEDSEQSDDGEAGYKADRMPKFTRWTRWTTSQASIAIPRTLCAKVLRGVSLGAQIFTRLLTSILSSLAPTRRTCRDRTSEHFSCQKPNWPET